MSSDSIDYSLIKLSSILNSISKTVIWFSIAMVARCWQSVLEKITMQFWQSFIHWKWKRSAISKLGLLQNRSYGINMMMKYMFHLKLVTWWIYTKYQRNPNRTVFCLIMPLNTCGTTFQPTNWLFQQLMAKWSWLINKTVLRGSTLKLKGFHICSPVMDCILWQLTQENSTIQPT